MVMNCQNCLWTIPKGIYIHGRTLGFSENSSFYFSLKKNHYICLHIFLFRITFTNFLFAVLLSLVSDIVISRLSD